MAGVTTRPEDGKMHEAIDLVRGGVVFTPPQLDQPLVVIKDGHTINLGRVLACGFEDGSGRSFYATTHRMTNMKDWRYKQIHIVLDDAIPSLRGHRTS